MLTAAIFELLYLVIFLVVLASGYIIKKNVIKMLEESDSLKSNQIKNGIAIVNTVYYTIVFIILTIIVAPFIIGIVQF